MAKRVGEEGWLAPTRHAHMPQKISRTLCYYPEAYNKNDNGRLDLQWGLKYRVQQLATRSVTVIKQIAGIGICNHVHDFGNNNCIANGTYNLQPKTSHQKPRITKTFQIKHVVNKSEIGQLGNNHNGNTNTGEWCQ